MTRVLLLVGAIAAISLLHYQTTVAHLWWHQVFQRAYYVPVVLAALWFGLRGGLLAASVAGLAYVPHILVAWGGWPAYSATQYIEVGMFFLIGGLTGVLADHEKQQREKIEDTARKLSELNEQLQASFEQLRRADRLSALGELSAGLAHEIRNPLGAVDGAVQILRREGLPAPTRQEFGELAARELNRLKELLTSFLDFARPQPPRRVTANVTELMDAVARLAGETAKMANVTIRVEHQDDLPGVSVDPEQIKQVLLNLVINAIQASPPGRDIFLRARLQEGRLAVEVEDQGVGVAPEDLERIFDPFFTRREGGTGLGLSIAYQIVNQHGGHISAARNPAGGMTFQAILPVAETRETVPVVYNHR